MAIENLDTTAIGAAIGAAVVGAAKVVERYLGTRRYDGTAAERLEEQNKIAKETREVLKETRKVLDDVNDQIEDRDKFFDRLLRHMDDQARGTIELTALLKAYLSRGRD